MANTLGVNIEYFIYIYFMKYIYEYRIVYITTKVSYCRLTFFPLV